MMRTEPAIARDSKSFILRGNTAASDIDGLPGQRKIQMKRRSLAGATLHANLARVFLDDSVRNRQAQPGTSLLACLRCSFRGEERIVDPRNVFGRNATSSISDADADARAVRRGHPDRPTRRHRILRVQEQIQKDLLQAPGVSLDGRKVIGKFALNRDARSAELMIEQGQRVEHNAVDVYIPELCAAGAREVEQVADDFRRPEGLPRDLLEQP